MAAVLLWAGVASAFADAAVSFPDANLSGKVHAALGLAPGDPIMESQLSTLTTLIADRSDITTLDGLEHATGLVNLDLRFNNITTITPLASLANLQSLQIGSNHISDLTPLDGLHNLTYLMLTNNQVSDLAPLSSDTSLTTLYADYNHVTDVTPVAALTKLAKLDLSVNSITNVTPLGSLAQLEELALNNNQITYLNGVGGHPKLTSLWIGANQVDYLNELWSDPALTALYAYDNQISGIAPLADLPNLQTLNLNYNQIADIGPLGQLTHLNYLDLHANQVTSLSPLAGLPLHWLDLDHNPIGSMSPLAGSATLEHLSVEGCGITSINGLSGLTHLYQLNVSANPQLSSIDSVATMPALSDISIDFTGITDLSALAHSNKLTSVSAMWTGVHDLEPLRNKPLLSSAHFAESDIWDISPLKNDPISNPLFYQCWIDFTPGGEASQTVAAWIANSNAPSGAQYYLAQRVPGSLAATVTCQGVPLPGVTMRLATGQTATTTAGGAALISRSPTGDRQVTFSKPYYRTLVTTVTVTQASTTSVSVALAPVQLTPTFTRDPKASIGTYKRRKGVATFALSVTLSDARGKVVGAVLKLQISDDGVHWNPIRTLTTDSNGRVRVIIAERHKRSPYFRWAALVTVADKSAHSPRFRVIVK